MSHKWSTFQLAIFAAVVGIIKTGRDLVVFARAGTGKSTTMVEAVIQFCAVHPRAKVLTCAFNKKNADDLRDKLEAAGLEWPMASAKTLNSVGLAACKRWNKSIEVDPSKGRKIAKVLADRFNNNVHEDERIDGLRGKVDKLATLAKITLSDPNVDGVMRDLFFKFGIGEYEEAAVVIRLATKAMDKSREDETTIDFADQLWFPWFFNMTPWKHDLVIVDECLPYKTPVLLADGTSKEIGDIVESKLPVTVLAYDPETETQRPCRVTAWQKILNQKPLVKVTVTRNRTPNSVAQFTNFVVCTEDHKIFVDGKWVEAGKLQPGMVAQVETSAKKSQTYKITSKGRKKLGEVMSAKNSAGVMKQDGTALARPSLRRNRKGNGHGLTVPQSVLLDALGNEWEAECAVPTKKPRGSGYPTAYKIDLAHPAAMVAVEVDGASHQARDRAEQDAKKDELLESLGWTVVRIPNVDAVQSTSAVVEYLNGVVGRAGLAPACVGSNCPVDATVVSVEPVNIPDYYVYDVTVEDCHNFYANGILVHNCQDMNASQLWLARESVKRGGRLVAVGDDRQAIYQWRGADSDFLGRMVDELGADTLTLPRTYRCGKNIVAEAKLLVPDFEAGENNPDGIVREADMNELHVQARPGDFIISRINAPLLSLCLKFLKRGVPALVQGRDIMGSLISTIEYSKCDTTAELNSWLPEYEMREVRKLIQQDADDNIVEALHDRVACLSALAPERETCEGLIEFVANELFSDTDDENVITLSSAHRAKGMERDRVWMLNSTFREDGAEDNVRYVAITRAKNELIYVNGT